MPAVRTDLTIEQGTTWSHGWRVTYSGEPIGAAWTARSQVRRRIDDPAVLHTFAATVTAQGDVILSADAAVSTAWTWTSGVYDVEVVGPVSLGSPVLRVAQGSVTVSPEVTRL